MRFEKENNLESENKAKKLVEHMTHDFEQSSIKLLTHRSKPTNEKKDLKYRDDKRNEENSKEKDVRDAPRRNKVFGELF